MNIKEAAQILTILSATYPNYYRKLSVDEKTITMNMWQKQFANVPAVIVIEALQMAIANCKFPPTIAEVNEQIHKIYIHSMCLENDMRVSQDERSEAFRLRILLNDLGYSNKEKSTELNVAKQILGTLSTEQLKLGGNNGRG